jgi:hypothetical protein
VRWQPLPAGFPAPGQKLCDALDRRIGDARENIAQIGLRIEIEHLAGLNSRKHGGRSLTARVGAEEDKIVACRRNWPDGSLGRIVGHLQTTISGVTRQCRPPRSRVSDGFGQGTRAADLLERCVEEALEVGKKWHRFCLANCEPLCRTTHKIKNRKSKRLEERQEIWFGLPRLGRVWLDAGMFPEGLQGVALRPQVYRQVPAGRCQARVAEIVTNRHQVGPGLQECRGAAVPPMSPTT